MMNAIIEVILMIGPTMKVQITILVVTRVLHIAASNFDWSISDSFALCPIDAIGTYLLIPSVTNKNFISL